MLGSLPLTEQEENQERKPKRALLAVVCDLTAEEFVQVVPLLEEPQCQTI